MRVLALASQKGGSGKTTLSGHLAVQAQRAGAGPLVRDLPAGRPVLLGSIAAALAMLGGCAGSASLKTASAKPEKGVTDTDRAVARSERAVRRAPQDAAARAALGQAYLAAGRFQSAATALNDAMTLGDNTGRTALALALAKIGSGRQREAIALLDDWRNEIPASDLGLALALAGEPARGVAILTDAVRSGESTPKLRQNLAYAYALDGRWSEARVMAAQDVPAAELDQRIAIWALSALPDRNQDRVASLIGAPLRTDPGQPAMLALKTDPAEEQLAAQDNPATPPFPEAKAQPDHQPATELPAMAEVATPPVIGQNLALQAGAEPVRVRPSVASAFAPIAQSQQAAAASKPPRAAAAARVKIASGGTHLVQLGAFSSAQGARRAWGILARRTPALAVYRMTITTANVHGKAFWRVAAAGLNGQGAAAGLCSQVKTAGGACFAYAAVVRAEQDSATPGGDDSGSQRARR